MKLIHNSWKPTWILLPKACQISSSNHFNCVYLFIHNRSNACYIYFKLPTNTNICSWILKSNFNFFSYSDVDVIEWAKSFLSFLIGIDAIPSALLWMCLFSLWIMHFIKDSHDDYSNRPIISIWTGQRLKSNVSVITMLWEMEFSE